MATGSSPAPARITADGLRQMCEANPVGPDGKRAHGTLDLRNADLSQLTFEAGSIDLSCVDFRDASLERCKFVQIPFRGSDLTGADADRAVFSGCDLQGAILRNVRGLPRISSPLDGAVVAGLDLSESATQDSILNAKDWHLARYDAAQANQLNLPPGHNTHARTRIFREYNFAGKKLAGFDFRGAILIGANLTGADLAGADLEDADLTDAKLEGANLTGAIVTADQLRTATNWLRARYGADDDDQCRALRNALQLPRGQSRFWVGNFSGCDFTGFVFGKNDLANADFRNAVLVNADLSGQVLTGTRFDGANLAEAYFRGADLTHATGLEAWQFRGADISGAQLPDEIDGFKSGVEAVDKIAPSAAKQFLGLLAACLYCWLTVATTTDAALILGSATLPLPVVQTPIRIVGFYWFGPLLLITAFLYFLLNLQRMWEALAKLPAIFRDGRRLDEHVYPWMLIQKVRGRYRRMRGKYTFIPELENRLGTFLAYGAAPITLLAFWYRALVKHDIWLTRSHIVFWTLALLFALQFRRYSLETFDGVPPTAGWRSLLSWPSAQRWGLALLGGAILSGITFQLLTTASADLRDAELSTKPDGWVEGQADTSGVKGAQLERASLQHARMTGAFLVAAHLNNANLAGANLGFADLRGAHLEGADMAGASMGGANVADAHFEGASDHFAIVNAANWLLGHYSGDALARLELPLDHDERLNRRDFRGYSAHAMASAYFRDARLSGANFEGLGLGKSIFENVDLSNAILRHCDFSYASLGGTKLTKADLRGADLSHAHGLTEAQLREAILDGDTKLPEAFKDLLPQPAKKKGP